jgi:hypothetical protein
MAKVIEEIIVLKLSKIFRDSEDSPEKLVSDEFIASLETLAAEVSEDAALIVEVVRAD